MCGFSTWATTFDIQDEGKVTLRPYWCEHSRLSGKLQYTNIRMGEISCFLEYMFLFGDLSSNWVLEFKVRMYSVFLQSTWLGHNPVA